MDYSEFKGFQVLLFFGVPLAFAVWQLIVTQRAQRAADEANDSPIKQDDRGSLKGSLAPSLLRVLAVRPRWGERQRRDWRGSWWRRVQRLS